jgi:hypothetical protein
VNERRRGSLPGGFSISGVSVSLRRNVMNEREREAKFRELAVKKVVYHLPDMERAPVRRDEAYRMTDEGPLMMDIYSPQDMKNGERVPVVVIALGYPDPKGLYRQMGWAVCWAQLIAGSGMAAVIYGTRDPADDIHAVLRHIRQQASKLGIDERQIGFLAASANVVVALSALMQDRAISCAALLCGITMDFDGSTVVADAAKEYGFVNGCAGKSVEDLPADVPLFIVRAGREHFPGLNEAMDRFVAKAFARNLPVTLVNHHTGTHTFDLEDDSDASREIIRQTLLFLQRNLSKP